jgi:hypothetical protein
MVNLQIKAIADTLSDFALCFSVMGMLEWSDSST